MVSANTTLLTRLQDSPIRGVSLHNVSLLRLDLVDELAPGNKCFKLQGYLAKARAAGIQRLVSFGGAWSNHLHALAAVGAREGLETVGIVRGGADEGDTAMLQNARAWGMKIERVCRAEYRRRNETDYRGQVQRRHAPCLLVPEGGAGIEGMAGCVEIAALISELAPQARRIVLPVGTGTTLAGLVAATELPVEIIGISALKNAVDLDAGVAQMLTGAGAEAGAHWRILHQFHCGGFARASDGLREFMLEFEATQGIELDPVYTGKALYAIHRLIASGEWSAAEPVLAVHTGGLQGRRGYTWLSAALP